MSTRSPARSERDAADSRERLLRAGFALVPQRGLKGLTVRAVAERADANLGSFVYHFGTRDAFVSELLERWYAPLFASLQGTTASDGDALATLRAMLLQLAAWLAEHRAFVAQLLLGAAAGEGAVLRFLRSLDVRHPALLMAAIGRAQAAGRLCRAEPVHQLMFLMSSLALPMLLAHALEAGGRNLPALALEAAR